jgi:hypothetical protein
VKSEEIVSFFNFVVTYCPPILEGFFLPTFIGCAIVLIVKTEVNMSHAKPPSSDILCVLIILIIVFGLASVLPLIIK